MPEPGDQILSPEELQALYSRLDRLIAEAKEMQTMVTTALADNRRRDQQRVNPESRRERRTRDD